MDAKNFTQELDKADNKLKATADRMNKVGKDLTGKLTLPIVAFGVAAVKSASDLNESMSAVETVFGDAADQVAGFGGSVAEAMGLSRQAALSFAATFGAILQGVGIVGDEAAGMSNDLMQTAADLASFYNTSVEDAVAALTSGLTGETEPLKRFGIILSEAAVQAYALANGIWDGNGAMTEAEKVQARYGAIMEKLGAAQGDFARTSGGLANQTRILRAEFGDLLAQWGQILLPIMMRVIQVLRIVTGFFMNLPKPIQTIIVVILLLLAILGPLLIGLSAIISALAVMAPLVGFITLNMLLWFGIILIIIAVLVLLYIAWQKNWFGIRDITYEVFDALKAFFVNLWSALVDFVYQFISTLQYYGNALIELGYTIANFFKSLPGMIEDGLRDLADKVREYVGDAVDFVTDLPDAIIDGIGDGLDVLYDFGKDMIQGLVNGILSMVDEVADAVKQIFDAGLGMLADFFKIGSPSKVMFDLGVDVMEGFNLGTQSIPADMAIRPDDVAAPFSGGSPLGMNGNGTGGGVIINLYEGAIQVNGAGDPQGVADAVVRRLLMADDRITTGAAAV